MSVKLSLENFRKVISLCQQHGFIHQSPDVIGSGYNFPFIYGPLGTEIKRNILKYWWRDVVTHQQHVVGIEKPPTFEEEEVRSLPDNSRNSNDDLTQDNPEPIVLSSKTNRAEGPLSSDILLQYENVLQISERKLPLGLAQVAFCSKRKEFNPDRFIFQPHMCTYLNLYFFCAPKDASRWQDSWHRARLQWWRKFSGTPSAFSSTDVKNEDGKQTVEVKYHFPWGEDVIERITNHGSKLMEELEDKRKTFLKGKDGRKLVLPHIITSVGILEGGMLAYLLEAYQSAVVPGQKGKKKRQFMRLNTSLCPIKVAIVKMEETDEIQEVSDVLSREFRTADINVLQVASITSSASSKAFDKLDQMGVPYAVLLSDMTVKSGVVKIRNRDTTLLQEIHISQVRQILQL